MLKRLPDWIEWTTLALAGLMLSATAVICLIQVGLRYFLHSSNTWAEELATVAFIWSVMLGIPVALRRNEHIRIDFIERALPRVGVSAIRILGWLLTILFFGIIAFYTLESMPAASRQLLTGVTRLTGFDVHLSVLYWAVPVGSALTILAAIERIVHTIIAGPDPAPDHTDDLAAAHETLDTPDEPLASTEAVA